MTRYHVAAAAAATILGAFASSAAHAGVTFLDPTITFTGTTAAGATDKNGNPNKGADDHAKIYNGPTQLIVDYMIALKDGKFDPTGSTVTFTTVYYTTSGTKTPSTFKTLTLPVSTATLGAGGSVETFGFDTTDWYPDAASDGIKNNGIKGTIDLKKRTGAFTSSYTDASNGDIYTYMVTGTLRDVPEPATWLLMIAGFGLTGLALRARRRSQAFAL